MREGTGLQSGACVKDGQLCVSGFSCGGCPVVRYVLPYHTGTNPSRRHVFRIRSALCNWLLLCKCRLKTTVLHSSARVV